MGKPQLCFCKGSEFINRRDASCLVLVRNVRSRLCFLWLLAQPPAPPPPRHKIEVQDLLSTASTHTYTPPQKQQAVTLT